MLYRLGSFLIALLLCTSVSLAEAQVNNVEVEGNQRISNSTILAYVNMEAKSSTYEHSINDIIKKLFNTGFFSDVQVNIKGNNLIVKVVENPLVNRIAFEGNSRLNDKDLRKELSMVEGGIYSVRQLQNDIKRIVKIYQSRGRYGVKVTPKLIELPQNRVNLVYEIAEGVQTKVKRVVFSGNQTFTDQKLKRTMLTKETAWYRFLSSADVYDPQRLEFDKELIRRLYTQNGYLDFRITSTAVELTPNKEGFVITFVLFEGPKYHIGNTSVTAKIKDINREELSRLVSLKAGDIYNEAAVDEVVEQLTEALGDEGYAFVEVRPELKRDNENNIVDIEFIIEESYKVYINRININNNTRTQDKVIRREFRLSEGDPYNTSKLLRSKHKIEGLGYFSYVDFKNNMTEDSDKLNVDVDVNETSTGAVNFAVGYNTAEGPLGKISLAEANFLGKGQYVELGYEQARRSSDVSFSFTEPYFMDRDFAAGFDVFRATRDRSRQSSFHSRSVGFSLRGGYNINEYLTHNVRYFYRQDNTGGLKKDSSPIIRNQQGNDLVSGIGHTLIYETLDNPFDPTKGYKLQLKQDIAGVGGDSKYLQNQILASYHHPLYKDQLILNLIARAGNIVGLSGKKIRINDNFFIGEEYIRGFDTSGISAHDKKSGDTLGSKTYYAFTSEVAFPVGLPEEYRVKGVLFHDLGSAFGVDTAKHLKDRVVNSKALRASYGVGLIWHSPAGTIRLEYGKAYKKEYFDRKRTISLSFGARTRL